MPCACAILFETLFSTSNGYLYVGYYIIILCYTLSLVRGVCISMTVFHHNMFLLGLGIG